MADGHSPYPLKVKYKDACKQSFCILFSGALLIAYAQLYHDTHLTVLDAAIAAIMIAIRRSLNVQAHSSR